MLDQPMSSPIMKMMLGFCCCCAATGSATVMVEQNVSTASQAIRVMLMVFPQFLSELLRRPTVCVERSIGCQYRSRSRDAWSGSGRVSRVSPVQTAMRNCTRDEGGPFEVGNQVLISSHRKLLLSKAMVVSVAETPGQDSGRQG